MTEEQADRMIDLLVAIDDKLDSIQSNTGDLSYIESNTTDTVDAIKKLTQMTI